MATSMRHVGRAMTVLASAAALAVTACSSSGGSTAAGTSGTSTASVQVPAGTLDDAGKLTFCADISSPPLTYYDENQNAVGAEIELGDALAKQLGVSANWANTAFNGIIPALQAKQCDAIMSQLYIKPDRAKVVDFVPYMYASNTLLTNAQHDEGINSINDLCGKKAAAETGTTASDYLTATSKQCTSDGKAAVDIRLFAKDSDALQQLKLALVDAYGTTLESASYVMKQQPGTFKLLGKPFGRVQTGIATRKDDKALHDALTKALAALHSDGEYDAILKKWNLQADALGSA